ncbi:MAG: HlyD family efflux transporter periplasmic adaptor subunit [Candidatus Absconditabacteria bacterium]
MKIKKSIKYLIIIVVMGIAIGGYLYFKTNSTDTVEKVINAKVTSGSIENTIKTTGTSKLVDEQEMKFNMDGEVTAVYFKAGDSVKKGDIIAQLDNKDALSSINQSQISLNNAYIELEQKITSTKDTDLISADNNIKSSESNIILLEEQINNIKKEQLNSINDKELEINNLNQEIQILEIEYSNKIDEYDSQIISKNLDIDSKQASLDILKNELETLIKQQNKSLNDLNISNNSTLNNAYNDIKKSIIDIDSQLNNIDVIFGITDINKHQTASYEKFLSAKDTSLKDKTEYSFIDVQIGLEEIKKLYNNLSSNDASSSSIIEVMKKVAYVYDDLITLGKYASDGAKNSIESTELSQQTIDSYYNSMNSIVNSAKSSLDNYNNSITNIVKLTDEQLQKEQNQSIIKQKELSILDSQSSLDKLKTDLINLNNTKNLYINNYETNISQKKQSIKSKQDSIIISKNTYELTIKQKSNDIINEKRNLELLKQKLQDLKDGPDNEEIQLSKNNIEKMKIQLESSKNNLDKYEIQAPFDGIIRKIDFKVGDKIVSTDSKYVYIENPNLVEITSTIDQIDIVNVKLGQKVKVIFDSYKNKEFEGIISEIDSTPVSSSGVTSYTITISIDKGEDNIYSGMTAKLYIIIASKENILLIPSVFINKKDNKSFVNTGNGQRGSRTEIKTGISDSTNTEILSGLNLGDNISRTVTVSTSSTATSTNSTNTRALRNATGAGGGGGTGGFRPPN